MLTLCCSPLYSFPHHPDPSHCGGMCVTDCRSAGGILHHVSGWPEEAKGQVLPAETEKQHLQ